MLRKMRYLVSMESAKLGVGFCIASLFSVSSALAMSGSDYCSSISDNPFQTIHVETGPNNGYIIKACHVGKFLIGTPSAAVGSAFLNAYNAYLNTCQDVANSMPTPTGTIESPSGASNLTAIGNFQGNNADAATAVKNDYTALKDANARLAIDTAAAKGKPATSPAVVAAKAAIAKGGVDHTNIANAKATLIADVKALAALYYTQIEAPWTAAVETCVPSYLAPSQCYINSFKTLTADWDKVFGANTLSLPTVPTTSATILSTCTGGETKLFNILVATTTSKGATTYKANAKNTTASDSCSVETLKATPSTPAKPSPDLTCRMLGAIGWAN